MNKWIGKGRLTKDPEVRYTQSGKAVASFTLACDKHIRKDSGDGQSTADFIRCVAWDKRAEVCGKCLAKGKELLVEGRIQTRSYEENGSKRYVTECVVQNMEFCGKKDDVPGGNGAEQGGISAPLPGSPMLGDEDIPF